MALYGAFVDGADVCVVQQVLLEFGAVAYVQPAVGADEGVDAALAQQFQRAGVEVAVEVGALDGGLGVERGELFLVGVGDDALLADVGRVGERDVKASPGLGEYFGE